MQRLYAKYLDFHDIDVVGIANNGEEAINMYKSFSTKPDVILMDNQMPVKSGMEAAKEIMQINRKQTIVFLSSDSKYLNDVFNGKFRVYDKSVSIIEMIKDLKNMMACC